MALPFSSHIAKYAIPSELRTPSGADPLRLASRHELYRTLEGYYFNTLFSEFGLSALDPDLAKNAATDTVAGIYNPVTSIVDTYVNWTLDGKLGDPTDQTADVTVESDNPNLPAAVQRIWDWSNMEREKLLIPFYASLLGDALLLVTARPRDGVVDDKVWIEVRHPEIVRHVEFDARRNIVYLELEERVTEQRTVDQAIARRSGVLSSMPETYVQTIIMTKTEFATLKDGKPFDFGNGASRWPNPWGFVPAKLVQHKSCGEYWGLNAFHESIPVINDLCLEATICSQLIGQWLTPQWAVFGIGRSSSAVSRNGRMWLFENSGDAKTLTASVDFPGAYTHINAQLKWLAERHPELNLTKVRDNNVTAGVAIRAMLFDLIKDLQMAQDNYDVGIVAALQMAMTMAQNIDGTGRSVQGFENLGRFEDGSLSMRFQRPDILPASKLEQAQAAAEIAQFEQQAQLGGAAGATTADAASILATRLLNGAP